MRLFIQNILRQRPEGAHGRGHGQVLQLPRRDEARLPAAPGKRDAFGRKEIALHAPYDVGEGVVHRGDLPAAPQAAPELAPGSAGDLMIHDVPERTAAILMAIVADKMGRPLNELRFISIKEVK